MVSAYKRATKSFMASALLGTAIALMPGAGHANDTDITPEDKAAVQEILKRMSAPPQAQPKQEAVKPPQNAQEFEELLKTIQAAQAGQAPQDPKEMFLSQLMSDIQTTLVTLNKVYLGEDMMEADLQKKVVDAVTTRIKEQLAEIATGKAESKIPPALAKEIAADVEKTATSSKELSPPDFLLEVVRTVNKKTSPEQAGTLLNVSLIAAISVYAPEDTMEIFQKKLRNMKLFDSEMLRFAFTMRSAEQYYSKTPMSQQQRQKMLSGMIENVKTHFFKIANGGVKDPEVSAALANKVLADISEAKIKAAGMQPFDSYATVMKSVSQNVSIEKLRALVNEQTQTGLKTIAPNVAFADFQQKLNRDVHFQNEMERLTSVVNTVKQKYLTAEKVTDEKMPEIAETMISSGKKYLNAIAVLEGEEAAYAEREQGLSNTKTKELIAVYENVLRTHRHTEITEKFSILLKEVSNNMTEKQFSSFLNVMINGMLASLDPHSSYFKSAESQSFIDSMSGEFGGLGIEVTKNQESGIVVKSVLKNGPTGRMKAAGKPSLEVDDVVTHITIKEGPDNKETTYATAKLSREEAVAKMKGIIDTDVTLTVSRPGVKDPLRFTIKRGKVEISMVKAAELLDGGIGYMRVSSFGFKASEDVKAAIAAIQQKAGGAANVKGYILDLVNNGGGEMGVATNLIDHFVPDNRDIIVSKARGGKVTNVRSTAIEGDITGGKPLVVLVNGGSASASEVTSGTLKEIGRATVIGKRTFGKGSFQTYIEFTNPDGSKDALKSTEGLYYLKKSDTSPQNVGISPHIETEDVNPGVGSDLSEAKMANTIPNPDHERSAAMQPDAKEKCVRADGNKSLEAIRASYDFLLTNREADNVLPGQLPQWSFDIACAHEFLTGKRTNTKVVPVTPKP